MSATTIFSQLHRHGVKIHAVDAVSDDLRRAQCASCSAISFESASSGLAVAQPAPASERVDPSPPPENGRCPWPDRGPWWKESDPQRAGWCPPLLLLLLDHRLNGVLDDVLDNVVRGVVGAGGLALPLVRGQIDIALVCTVQDLSLSGVSSRPATAPCPSP